MDNAKHFTTTATGSALLAVAVANGLVAAKSADKKDVAANVLSMTIAVVAYLHYKHMVGVRDTSLLRHSDWLITCPLLVFEIGILLGSDNMSHVVTSSLLAAMMVMFGLGARRSDKHRLSLWCAGAVCLAGIFVLMKTKKKDGEEDAISRKRRCAGWLFLLVWLPYGVAFWAPVPLRDVMFNVLDLVSKVGLGTFVAVQALGKG